MKNVVVVGSQWGDEGKGKIVDWLSEQADVVVVRFGEKYKQWNAAFDAGYAAALGKPLIVMHQDVHQHALKEVDAAALVVAQTPLQVADALRYVMTGALPK